MPSRTKPRPAAKKTGDDQIRYILIGGIGFSAMSFILLKFIPGEMVLPALGFLGLTAYVGYESFHRRQQINNISDQLVQLNRKYKKLASVVAKLLPESSTSSAKTRQPEKPAPPAPVQNIPENIKADPLPVPLPAAPPLKQQVNQKTAKDFAPGQQYSDAVVSELIQQAIDNNKVDVFIQPVMKLPEKRAVFYELFARIRARPGVHLPAQKFIPLARQENIVPELDDLLLTRTLQILKDTQAERFALPLFLNISAQTLADTHYIGDLLTYLEKNHRIATRLIFDIPQADFLKISSRTKAVMSALSKLGCRFAMDQVVHSGFTIQDLKQNNISYIKFDMNWLLSEKSSPYGQIKIRDLIRQIDQAGIEIIAEKVEDAIDIKTLASFNISLSQGFLFQKPEAYDKFIRRHIRSAA